MRSRQADNLVPVSSAVPPSVRDALNAIARKNNRSVSQVIRFVLERYARRQKAA